MKQFRVGIIGSSNYVKAHVKAINESVPEFRVVALVDTSPEKIARLRHDHLPRRRVAVYDDYRKMLTEVAPDVAIVSTPHTLHFRHAHDAIRAGAHVLVEKPMVTSTADARRLVAAAEKHKRNLQIAIQGTYTDTFAYARSLIADGTAGALQLVTAALGQNWMKATAGKWRQDPRLAGGGQLYDSCAHVLSAMMFLVDSPVREAFCWADNCGTPVDINAVACVRFENGCMAAITSGGNCAKFFSSLSIQGENALIEISPHGGGFRVTGLKDTPDITAVPEGWGVPTVAPIRNFADVIQGRAEPRCGGRLGILLAELMDALYASAAAGKPVKVIRE